MTLKRLDSHVLQTAVSGSGRRPLHAGRRLLEPPVLVFCEAKGVTQAGMNPLYTASRRANIMLRRSPGSSGFCQILLPSSQPLTSPPSELKNQSQPSDPSP